MTLPYLSSTREGTLLSVHILPKSKQNALQGCYGGRLKIKIQAPPVDGKANEALIQYLAELLELAARDIELKRGHQGRQKQLLLKGVTIEEASQKLG